MSQDAKTADESQAENGEERRVSLSITVRPSTRARLELAATRGNNTISRIAEMAMIEWLDEADETDGKKKKKKQREQVDGRRS